MSPNLGIIIVPTFFVLSVLLIGGYRLYRRRHPLRPYERVTASAAEYERNLAERDRNLYHEVQKRKEQEKIATNGTQVWFSRHLRGGNLKHWALYIDGIKYELRRDATTTGRYTYMVTTDPRWSVKKELREVAMASKYIPEVNEFYICLIGWTSKSAPELNHISADVMRQFGSYNILWNNCQDFLQQFADIIIAPDKRALDWAWFREHAKTEYQLQQKLPPTPEVVKARMATVQASFQQQNIQQQNFLQQQNFQQQLAINGAMSAPIAAAPVMMG